MFENLRTQFLLDPNIIFLNHGSFGACPRPVFEAYQKWQLELEHQPVEFLGRRSMSLLENARKSLGAYLNSPPEDIVYFPNPTTAINMVARSLNLSPGDEILTTDHEYGAMSRTWRFICKKSGAKYIQKPVPLPLTSKDEFIHNFWQGVTERTRIIFISHITSPTGLIFPVEEICKLAREVGILSIVDGAHTPGQIPVDLANIGADIYTGACHKWMMAPKGASFLYAQKEVQVRLEPLVVSWGYTPDPGFGTGIRFIDNNEWQGTRDIAAYLSVPTAIEFMEANQWDKIRNTCHQLARYALEKINKLTGMDSIYPDKGSWYGQMVSIRLPGVDVVAMQKKLYEKYHIEIPVMRWNDQPLIRVSIQAYNAKEDIDFLVDALNQLINYI